ncbi:MAG: hypothetical protein D8M57_06660 [Candidatus Scalindua sp. AMX11]|nr:MAG: hypothetical protein DWQ00_13735 [Candidatus Scalindua sp.]TDE65763.1 MAG: hypothetical protein D8M57_06660 [Candidatus Scalindua sp. AMX11]
MNLTILRSFAICISLGYSLLIILSFDNNFSYQLSNLIETNLTFRTICGILGFWGALGIFYLCFSMIYHWAHANFASKRKKIFCFSLLTV